MFVEKLSLFGFKSFNQKIHLDFGPGISGVIGPNGCGKSNIVDALRWVLGEQSTKQLRGSKMEDVIFNGTREEKPLSLAEVELTLNNDRGRLPIDYGQVTVGRRLYRSGISEYTINKQPVRLKDVRDLFLDTGMGSHAYSVIERTMVDNILSDTTGHRRFLFEEAAGIMKYKSRKKEALNKLEATDRDLVRVSDIISEVDRQVTSLRRQVGKARRYRELMEEIRGIDLAWSQTQRRRWLDELGSLDETYRSALNTAEAGETEVATLEARLEALHLTVLEEERKLSEAREELAQVDDEIGNHNSRIMVLRERLTATTNRIAEARELKVRLVDRLERNTLRAEEVTVRLTDLGSREGTERARLDQGETELTAAESRVRELRDGVAGRKQEAIRLRDERIRAEGEVETAGRRLEDLEARLSLNAERIETARTRTREFAESLEVSRGNASKAASRVAELENDREVLEVRRKNLEERIELHRRRVSEKRQEEAAAGSRLSTLENLRERYEGFDPGVRALMLDEGRDPGVRGTLGDLIQVPGEWREALEPALSAAWQFVVVNDTGAARRLLDRLRDDSLGYATLIALDRVPEAPERNGDVRWAAETVQATDDTRGLVRYLLGDLALVESLDEAIALVGEGRAPRAATRSGQYVDAAVLAGGQGGPAGAELLERQETIERCRRDIETLAGTLDALTGEESELRSEEEALDAELAGRLDELEAARTARAALDREEADLRLEERHAAEILNGLEEERSRLDAARNTLNGERDGLTIRLSGIGDAAGEAEKALTELEELLARAEGTREEVLARVHEMRMSWARLEGELKDARSTDERLRQEREDLASERDRTVRDEEEAVVRVGEIERDLKDLGAKIEELHRARTEKQDVVVEREREKSEASAREQEDADRLREVRRRAGQARQAAHDSELRLSEIRSDVKHLEERLYEEYEVTAEELDRVEAGELPEDAHQTLVELKDRLKRIGPVNLLAVEEFEEKRVRLEFMTTQRDDLLRAKDTLVKTIEQINHTAARMFMETFTQVQENFQKTFQVLFQGGECSLGLVGDDPLEADIEVMARPRGKRPQSIAQLSSGERALTAIALLFAIYLVKPSPFCILDEVDAPLDDANIDRFVAMVKEFSKRTQFIVITHNKKTMEASDCLYGVTMQRPGVSSVVSVKLDGLRAEEVAAHTGAGVRGANGSTRRNGGTNGGGNGSGDNGHGSGDDEADPLSPESMIAQ